MSETIVLSRQSKLSLVKTVKKVVPPLALVYVIGVQIPLLSPFRSILVDEFIIADSSYALASGHRSVPTLQVWSHIIPAFGAINFHYTPLYFYLSALTFYFLGLAPQSVGVLHFVLRLLSLGVFLLMVQRLRLKSVVQALLAMLWATFVQGPVGRPEDLGILFLTVSVFLLLNARQSNYAVALAGVCQGLAFLSHPSALLMGFPLGCAVLYARVHGWQVVRKGGLFWGATAATSALWLFWIVPYWREFQVIFLGFVLPDAAATPYVDNVREFWKMFLAGSWYTGSALTLIVGQYSLMPVFLLVLYFSFWIVRRKENVFRRLIILLPLVLFVVLASRNEMYWAPIRWFNVGIVLLIPIVVGRGFLYWNRTSLMSQLVGAALVSIIALQFSAHFLLQGLVLAGDAEMRRVCGSLPHVAALSMIPPGEKILTNEGYVFYQRRAQNPIFWPAGLRGKTFSGIAYNSSYDASFKWLVVRRDLNTNTNPGMKFQWDEGSYQWFSGNFLPQKESSLDQCTSHSKLTRFSQLRRDLYIYKRVSGI